MKTWHLVLLGFALGAAAAHSQVFNRRVQSAPPHALLQPRQGGVIGGAAAGSGGVTLQRPTVRYFRPVSRAAQTNIVQASAAPLQGGDDSFNPGLLGEPLEQIAPAPSPSEGAADRLRAGRAEVLRGLGFQVDWTRHTASELLDMELRLRAAARIRSLGYETMWQSYTLAQLEDRERRILTASALEKKGVEVNWTRQSLEELTDIEHRVRKSERLAHLGKVVNWERYSLGELAGMEVQTLRLRGRR